MKCENDAINSLKKIFGPENVLTDFEDRYVYSFEQIFREKRYPRVDAVVKVQSNEEIEKFKELTDEQCFKIIQRSNAGALDVDKFSGILIAVLDDVKPPDISSTRKLDEKLVAENVREIHRNGHGTFRNLALAVKTLFLGKNFHRCEECATCSGYCAVAHHFNNIETWSSKGRIILMKGLAKNELTISKKFIDVLYSCSMCGLCFAQCFSGLEVNEAILATRRKIAEERLPPQPFDIVVKNIFQFGDPGGMPPEKRVSWTRNVPELRLREKSDILYWVGCMVATRTPNTAEAFARILNKANIEFTMLGENEGCCGYVLFVSGLWNEAKELSKRLVKKVEETGAETVVTPCAGCYYTFTKLYPKLLGIRMPCEVLHTSQFLDHLMHKRILEPANLDMKLTYHDPCSLGRHSNVYDAPRNVFKAIPSLRLIEMPLNKNMARCCGGGGGLWTFNHHASMSSAFVRLKTDVAPLNVAALTTACPTCQINFRYAAIKNGLSTKVCDITEIVWQSIKNS